jgi:hypothetical protein
MNIFRSEEHIRNWSGFKAGTEEGIMQLSDMAKIFSLNLFTRRQDTDYVSRMQEYMNEFIGVVREAGSFWKMTDK